MIEELAERIWSSEDFKTDYRELLKYGLTGRLNGDQGFEDLPIANEAPGEEAVQKLVQSAANLSATQQVEYREAAYRIAVYVLAGYSNSLPNIASASKVIFGRLGNFPAAGFLENGGHRETTRRLPLPLWLDYAAHSAKNTVEPSEEVHLTLTDFQKSLWDSLVVSKATSFTAPTSAGKTFALQHYLVSRYLKSSAGVFVYLVPTRALISQVVADVAQISSKYEEEFVSVSSVPLPQEDLGVGKTIYILTQERLQILLERDSSLDVRVLVVDEAQELGAGSRGVILQTVVDRIRRIHPEAQFLFSSPQASNPDLFGELFGLEDFEVVEESESPVAQNLLFVGLDRESGSAAISARLEEETLELGSRKLPERSISRGSGKNRVLAAVAEEFGRGGTSLIYAGAPSRCESIAAYLCDLTGNGGPISEEDERKRTELSEFLKDHIHEDYLLATTVQSGVGYHYGNMPSIVRRLIERYFCEGVLNKLVSTSTLLHGVNLAAQNLFLLNPTKGKNTPLTDVEFWNLAGRAGRLTKDFEGNIFVVEPSKWSAKQFDGDRRSSIEPSLRESVAAKSPEFIEFINDVEHPSGKYEQYESSFVRLFNDAREGSLRDTLERLNLEEDEYLEVLRAVERAVEKVSVPADITEEHINISVYRQQDIWAFLEDTIDDEGPHRLIPAHPLSGDAYDSYKQLFKWLHRYFERVDDNRHRYFALIGLRWMKGESYAEMIGKQHSYRQKSHKGKVKLATTIRGLLRDINQDLRFRYVKYMRCYVDILRSALIEAGFSHLRERIPPVPLFLELGASSRTMVNLIGLGLSRTSAGIVHQRVYDVDMTRDEVMEWLRETDLAARGIPELCVEEVREILG